MYTARKPTKQTHTILLFRIYLARMYSAQWSSIPCYSVFVQLTQNHNNNNKQHKRMKLLEWMSERTNILLYTTRICVFSSVSIHLPSKRKIKRTRFFPFFSGTLRFFCGIIIYCWFVRKRDPIWEKMMCM